MKHEELMNMSAKDLKARLKEIGKQAETAEGEVLDTLTTEAEDINNLLQDAANRAKLSKIAGAVEPEEGGEGEGEKEVKDKQREERGKELKNGNKVVYQAKTALGVVQNALSTTQTVLPKHTATDIKETFNDVSSLVDRVHAIPLNGGETYQRAETNPV